MLAGASATASRSSGLGARCAGAWLADGRELRYRDTADMGKVYLARDLDQVPAFARSGSPGDRSTFTLDAFRERLNRHRVRSRDTGHQSFVAGIGNAYADEILWSLICTRSVAA
jgi:formamidopyrimidine-DNA glycosylase